MTKIRQDIEENLEKEQESYGELPSAVKEKIEWFKDQKIGVIFHWGLYAQAGIVESWQLSKEDTWARKKGAWREDLDTLRKDYWSLEEAFDPTRFDPEEWAELSRKAGFHYMIFTTKHHDGFTMYDTKYSEYKVTGPKSGFKNHPKADVLAEVNKAFRKQGLGIGAYYSKADWHDERYWEPGADPIGRYASYDPKEKPEKWEEYNQFVENQLVEIAEGYGPLDILWLDGGWVNHDNHEYLNMPEIAEKLRTVQEDVLIVDRTIGGDYENYVTPERKVPERVPNKAWETNIPLAKNWGYVPKDIYKPFSEILDTLIQVIALGGNILLGVGPKPDGTLPEKAVQLMEDLGKWLTTYGEGIYGTRPVPEIQLEGCFLTKKGSEIFIFKRSHTVDHLLDLTVFGELERAVLMETNQQLSIDKGQVILPPSKERYMCVRVQLK